MKYYIFFMVVIFSGWTHAQNIHGPELYNMINQTLDISQNHREFLSAQAQKNTAFTYFSTTVRMSPVTFVMGDGKKVTGRLTRAQNQAGFGFGRPDKWSLFFGGTLDFIYTKPGSSAMQANAAQDGLLFMGAGLFGFQMTFAGRPKNSLSALDSADNFRSPSYGNNYSSGRIHLKEVREDNLLTFYHVSGAFLSLSYGQVDNWKPYYVDGDSSQVYYDFKTGNCRLLNTSFRFQPLKSYLPKIFGLPFIGFDRLSTIQQRTSGSSVTSSGSRVTTSDKVNQFYQLALGADDILKQQIRVAFFNKISPGLSFKRLEVAKHYEKGKTTSGLRFVGYKSGSSLTVSGDAYILYHAAKYFHIGLSYSYNSPDATTFFPIDKAHVFGAQLVIGQSIVARPLIPLIKEWEKANRN